MNGETYVGNAASISSIFCAENGAKGTARTTQDNFAV